MVSEMIITAMEYIGTVSFAVSGTLVAIACSLDLFGVLTVGCITAVGGGIIRDLLIGNTPPLVFFKPQILILAVLTSLVVFVISYKKAKNFSALRGKLEKINIVFDAFGLGAFSVMGVEVACVEGFFDNAFLSVFLGVLTGVGGGIIRDILVNEKPYVLTKHIYAAASIVGSTLYYFISVNLNQKVLATFVGLFITVIIRLFAAKYRWNFPKIKFEE